MRACVLNLSLASLLVLLSFIAPHVLTFHLNGLSQLDEPNYRTSYYRYWCNVTLYVQGDISDLSDLNVVMLFPNVTGQTALLERALLVVDGEECSSYKLVKDEDGNTILTFDKQLTALEEGSIVSTYLEMLIIKEVSPPITVSVDYASEVSLNNVPGEVLEAYAGNKTSWIIPREVYEAAMALAGGGGSILEVLDAISRWIEDIVAYPLDNNIRGVIGPQYPLETLELGIGDCDDSSILFISMCRAVGIPSFLQLGCIYKPGDAWQEIVMHQGNYVYRSKGIGWHAWSMVYIPSVEWIPVDLTYFNDAQLTSKTGEPLVYIKSPGGVKAKIEGAALLTVRPLIYANYSSLRYVDDVRAWEKAIAEGRLRYLQSEELKLMAYGGISRLPIPLSVPLAACAAFTALLLVVYLRLKIKRKTT